MIVCRRKFVTSIKSDVTTSIPRGVQLWVSVHGNWDSCQDVGRCAHNHYRLGWRAEFTQLLHNSHLPPCDCRSSLHLDRILLPLLGSWGASSCLILVVYVCIHPIKLLSFMGRKKKQAQVTVALLKRFKDA